MPLLHTRPVAKLCIAREGNMSIIFFFLVLSWQSLKVNTMSVEVNDGLKILSHDYSIVSSEPSRAVLARDPNASLPISFTICSTIMAPHVFPRQDLVFAYLMDRFENVLVQISTNTHIRIRCSISFCCIQTNIG